MGLGLGIHAESEPFFWPKTRRSKMQRDCALFGLTKLSILPGAIIPQKQVLIAQTAAASRNIFKVAARWRRNCCCTLLQLPQSAFACYTAHALCRDRCFADIKVQVCGIPPAMKNLACGMSEASLRFPVSKVDGREAANNVSPANRENAAHPSVCRHFRNTRFWHSQI